MTVAGARQVLPLVTSPFENASKIGPGAGIQGRIQLSSLLFWKRADDVVVVAVVVAVVVVAPVSPVSPPPAPAAAAAAAAFCLNMQRWVENRSWGPIRSIP